VQPCSALVAFVNISLTDKLTSRPEHIDSRLLFVRYGDVNATYLSPTVGLGFIRHIISPFFVFYILYNCVCIRYFRLIIFVVFSKASAAVRM